MMNPSISVAICTWNRAESLRQTLQGLQRLMIPAEVSWELLVVDNNSTDHTTEVIADFTGLLPLTSVSEHTPGLSNARNAAIDHGRGDYIIWTDDDVTVDPHWLAAYHAAFALHPDGAFFGGRIVPVFEGGIQPWVRSAWPMVKDVFAERDLGADQRCLPTENNEFPYGANFAIRMTEQRRHRYDAKRGNIQNTLSGGEETAVMASIVGEGGSGYWVPDSCVLHRIEASRQRASFIARYFRARGAHAARTSSQLTTARGCPRWLYRQWLGAEMRYRWLSLTGSPAGWVEALRDVSRVRGYLDVCRRQARGHEQ